MKQRIALLALGMLVLTACSAPESTDGEAMPKGDLAGYVVAPTHQSIRLRIDPEAADYSGSTTIDINVREATSEFAFHAEEMQFDTVMLTGSSGEVDVTLTPGAYGLQVATTAEPLAPGDYTLTIDFSNEYDGRAVGLYKVETGGDGYLFTQFEAVDARKAFPCWDEPGFKINYQLTLEVPEHQVAVTNTPVDSENSADGWRTTVFAETEPMPTYLIAMAAGPLESVPIPGMNIPGRVLTVKGQSAGARLAVETTPPLLAALEAYFGRPYPYRKLDLIAVPDYWPGAMENPGLITFKDSLLLPDPDNATVGQRRTLAAVTAHELAHMWFGDLVTMQWWDDLWLNESFASWLGDKITDEVYPEYRISVSSVRSTNNAMVTDARLTTTAIRKPVVEPSQIMEDLGLAYNKGQAVLEMVEGWIGEEDFRKGVISYIEAHAWKNAEADNLWGALSEASGKDVTAMLSGFINQPGVPMLTVETTPDGSVSFEQSRFVNHGAEAPDQTWTIPVAFRYSASGETMTERLVINTATDRTDVGKPVDWVMPNEAAAGYYRWVVPQDQLLAMSRNAWAVMDSRERIAFLGNAGALLDAGKIGGDTFLEVLNAFADDEDPEVVSALLGSLGKVRDAFVPDAQRDSFGVYVRQTLGPAARRFGLEHREGEDETISAFRPRLMAMLGEEGRDEAVAIQARKIAEAYMNGRDVDPSLVGTALRIHALNHGDRALHQAYKKRFESAKNPVERRRYLGAVASFTDPELQAEALAFALAGEVRPTEMFQLVGGMPDSESSNALFFDWVLENHEAIAGRIPPDFRGVLATVAGGCSEEQLARGQEFFMRPENKANGTEANLSKAAESTRDCVSLREREGASVAAYLRGLSDAS